MPNKCVAWLWKLFDCFGCFHKAMEGKWLCTQLNKQTVFSFFLTPPALSLRVDVDFTLWRASGPVSSFLFISTENPTIKNWEIQALFNTAASCDAGRGMGAVWECRGQGALSGTSSRSSDQSPWCFAGLTCCRSTPVAIVEMQRGSCTAPDDFIGPVQPQPSLALPLAQVCPSSHPQPYAAQKNARATTFFC